MQAISYQQLDYFKMTTNKPVIEINESRFILEFDISHEVFLGQDNKTDVLKDFIARRLEKGIRAHKYPVTGLFTLKLTPFNPLIDVEAILKSLDFAVRNDVNIITCTGGIGGTMPLEVRNENATHDLQRETVSLEASDSMRRYRTTFDVLRQKRLKIFFNSMMNDPFFLASTVEEIASFLSSEQGTDLVLSYGENVTLSKKTACPLCESVNIHSVHPTIGWPRVGFLTCNSQYYSECRQCTYIFLNPTYLESDCHKYCDDADSEIGANKTTTIAHTSYYLNFCDAVSYLNKKYIDSSSLRFIDIGAGECFFSQLLRQSFSQAEIYACDFKKPDGYALDNSRITFTAGNFFHALESCSDGSLTAITAFELIEHLTLNNFQRLIKLVKRKLQENGSFIFSTPDKKSTDLNLTDFWLAYAPQHLSIFNRDVLKEMIEKDGLKIQSTLWRSYAFNNNDTELSFYKQVYQNSCSSISSHMEFLIAQNNSRLHRGERCLSGDNQGCEIIIFAEKSDRCGALK